MVVAQKVCFDLDGRRIETAAGKTVLQAALDAGVYIPHLCYSPILEAYGGCRLCLVEIEGVRDPVASCTTPVRDGMVVRSETIAESTCESCGACVDLCPVGALWARSETLPPTEEVKTVCPYCGVGCVLVLGTRGGRIVSVRGDDSTHNQGQLCVKGRFAWEFVHSPDRLTTPLVRKSGDLREATWDEAYDLIAERLASIKDASGPDSIVFWSSAKATNEANYLVQKMARAAVGTNNIDNCARN